MRWHSLLIAGSFLHPFYDREHQKFNDVEYLSALFVPLIVTATTVAVWGQARGVLKLTTRGEGFLTSS